MLFLILASVFIFIILFTFGDSFLLLYKKIYKVEEHNSIIEKSILGMGVITILLSITSLIFPSNHYVLLALTICVVLYWSLNKERLILFYRNFLSQTRCISKVQWLIPFLFILLLYTVHIYGRIYFDEANYYIQQVMSNEAYSVIYGYANLEERLGFNSNFYLLLAPFSFKFLLRESPHFIIHLIFASLVFIWLFKEIIRTSFEFKRVILIVLYVVYIWLFINLFYSISNDAIIHVIVFYLVARACLYPEEQEKKYLLYILTLVYLTTVKISIAPFSFVLVLYFIYNIIKTNNLKMGTFILLTSLLLLTFWCIRNVIISGYLIYPIYEFDFFDVDWKVPQEILLKERTHINYGIDYLLLPYKRMMNSLNHFFPNSIPFKHALFTLLYLSVAISVIGTFVCTLFKRRQQFVHPIIYWIFGGIVLQLAVSLLTNCNERFSGSILLLSIYLFIHILSVNRNKNISPVFGYFILSCSLMLLVTQVVDRFKNLKQPLSLKTIIVPFTIDEKTHNEKSKYGYVSLTMNNGVTIYIAQGRFTYDVVPAATRLKEGEYEGRFQDYEKIEARGTRVEDGFRYKVDK